MGHHRRGLFDFFSDHDEHHDDHGEHHDYGHHDYGHHGDHHGHYDEYDHHHPYPAYEPPRRYADEEVIPAPGTAASTGDDAAIAALRERFARGEIDRPEYEERLAILEGRSTP